MAQRNSNIARLTAGYLFPEIARRRQEFSASHPNAKIISLGVGNTTEPILPHIANGLVQGAQRLSRTETYMGYMDEGLLELREQINKVIYAGQFNTDEIFISDGSKCDIGRLQWLFGPGARPVVQDPSYPVYVDGSVLAGAAGAANEYGYDGIIYMPCVLENEYFPDLSKIGKESLIYFCSPNNPTGAVSTKEQLKMLVEKALKTDSIIIFDAAYSEYIRDDALPKTIYAVDGAERCAIEVNSFSKSAGFTGVRLGWSVVPKALKFSGGESVNADWSRVQSTIFNGASNIAQFGALAALDVEGQKEIRELTGFYLENAGLIRGALRELGIECTGGDNSPYIWARFPGENSWQTFERILEKCHVVSTPGSGFGAAGEGYIRFSAFSHRDNVEEACQRLKTRL
ncbi:MAG: LL-diaminopimelate aminotransferase [Spirochaetaceae bacterium]|jgi:LL-diaminopimelate aminotransferase|nr:LL-diaminopimelate aminotransferase [Spirochaetaceae bacterium]GMO17442.1 MAG: LL-diaminopimelate aminotransferase [Termitinemataceae bacterium]